jgi:hypothetical protein
LYRTLKREREVRDKVSLVCSEAGKTSSEKEFNVLIASILYIFGDSLYIAYMLQSALQENLMFPSFLAHESQRNPCQLVIFLTCFIYEVIKIIKIYLRIYKEPEQKLHIVSVEILTRHDS